MCEACEDCGDCEAAEDLPEDPALEARIKALVKRTEAFEIGTPGYLEIQRELEEISNESEFANNLVDYFYHCAG